MENSKIIPQFDGNVSVISLESSFSQNSNHETSVCQKTIPVHISDRQYFLPNNIRRSDPTNLIRIKRDDKLIEASRMPVVVNLNPRSLYNKLDEFRTLIEQSEAGVCCISETWDRTHTNNGTTITDLLPIDGYCWIKNVVQRKRRGGKPAILASTEHFHVTALSPDIITVPIDVEAAWALLTPKYRSGKSRFNHIAVASVYYSSTQTRRGMFLDHIIESYNILCTKFGSDLGFLMVGDINRVRPIKGLVTPPPEICPKINTHYHACVTLVLVLVYCNFLKGILSHIHKLYLKERYFCPDRQSRLYT